MCIIFTNRRNATSSQQQMKNEQRVSVIIIIMTQWYVHKPFRWSLAFLEHTQEGQI